MVKSICRFALSVVAVILLASCGGNKATDKANDSAGATEQQNPTSGADVSDAPKAGIVNTIADGSMVQPADLPIIIDFSAVWCGPCKRFAPTFEAAAEEYSGKFYFYTVDIDKCPAMAEKYSVTSIPQVSVLYPDGRIVNNEPGFMEKEQFDAFLNGIL